MLKMKKNIFKESAYYYDNLGNVHSLADIEFNDKNKIEKILNNRPLIFIYNKIN